VTRSEDGHPGKHPLWTIRKRFKQLARGLWRKEPSMAQTSSSAIGPSSSPISPTPYFLELYGETKPQFDPNYAQVLAYRDKDTAGPIYEYFWTLGRYDRSPDNNGQQADHPQSGETPAEAMLRRVLHLKQATGAGDSGWGKFADGRFAQVYLLFPRSRGWRVHEVAASVKYLAPIAMQKTFLHDLDKDIGALQPLLGVAGTVAGATSALGAGPVGSATGHILDAVAKMKVGSVPQAHGFDWFVEKITTRIEPGQPHEGEALKGEDGEDVDGIVWHLPQSMFEALGSRINGSIAVSVFPMPQPQRQSATTPASGSSLVRACALLPLVGRDVHLPSDAYVYLPLNPGDANSGSSGPP